VPNNDQRPATNDLRKAILGILAMIFLLGALGCLLWPPSKSPGLEWEAACCRIGPILAVLWLAYDDLKRIPWWLWIAAPIVLFIIIKWKIMVLFCIPILILIGLLKPRLKRR
jgi:hypothetical protein